jgi:hypothetical protein
MCIQRAAMAHLLQPQRALQLPQSTSEPRNPPQPNQNPKLITLILLTHEYDEQAGSMCIQRATMAA